jgi:hypothetical protein
MVRPNGVVVNSYLGWPDAAAHFTYGLPITSAVDELGGAAVCDLRSGYAHARPRQAFTPNRRFIPASVYTLSELILAHQRYRVSGLLCAVVAEAGQVVTEAQLELGPDFAGPATEPGAAFADGRPCKRVEEDVLGFDQVGC